ncbi:Retrovirus-related Pol polyprotein from transposon TNT 1-94 [Vitis vinifera]|uniref:Retrovirus-related Pol polyprotein from transposon TNT 1-94 n=1 Tax=Vitis vinifera TaxID=29760 RepID=A0A438I060_VITVI|nr:Retrovirus-related Pol polyprotein from transposon TNT 1-94 [Vitis vinifera]
MGQGYEDHLVTQEADIPEVDRVQWRKIDAQLCSVLWQSVDPRTLLHLQAYKTCFKFWTQAKGLYTNDIQRLYKVASAIVHLSQQDLDLSTYIGQIASLEQFLTVMPLTPDVGAQQTQLDKFFMSLLLLASVRILEPIRDQILGSSSVPSLDDFPTLPLEEDAVVTRGRGQRPHCTYCNKLGHTRDRCYQLHGRPPPHCPYGQSSDSPLPQPPSSSGISDILRLLLPLLPSLLNGSQTVAKGIGLALPLPSLPLTSVLYTPECPFNLISISKITRTLNCSITFSDKFVTLQDRSTGKTIGIGLSPSSRRWFLVFSTLSSLPCESCQLGKHTRVSFPKRLNNRAKSPFELVHTDVWGPCRTASTLGFQYFVTFIDDYSRCTCPIYFVYVSSWILHQSSCAHTPQQNGVAERKNRHLVETARTLLLHSHVPFRFWGDAILTACYLINRMPSSVLHDQIPHSLLFPDQPLYFLPPRVFGCTCFVHILTPGQDKLSAKAMKCLFLGYSRLQKGLSSSPRVVAPLPFPEAPADSLPIPSASPAPALPSPNDLPIAVRKGTRSTRNPHPIYNFLSYHRLSSPYSAFVSAISSVSLPKSTHEALSHPGWRQAMVDEMAALHSNGTWDLVVLPLVDRLKARLVAKGYTQVYGSDYGDTFSPVAKIASVRLLLSMAAMCSWPLYQLDIKNAFLHGDLAEEVYMEQPPGFVAQGESGLVCRLRRSLYGLKQSPRAWFSRFSSVVQEFGMLRSTADHSVFYHHNSLGQCIYLVVYVDDIVITGSDQDDSSIQFWCGPFQRKYALDILEETGMLDCKPVDTPMDPNVKLVPGQGEPLGDPGDIDGSHWDAVIRILRYIKSTPGQGVLYENRGHTQVVGYTDADWAGSPTDRRSTSGYCVFIGGNLISWKSKKQDVVARSSAEAEYRAMALATCELIWLRHLLQELRFGKDEQMKLICDNQAALHIASNPVFHERTKHIEVDCHFIREKIASGCVATSFVNSNDQLADIFTKSLRGPRIKYICNKLGAYDVYAPA